jgi:hypothetical protein
VEHQVLQVQAEAVEHQVHLAHQVVQEHQVLQVLVEVVERQVREFVINTDTQQVLQRQVHQLYMTQQVAS